MIISILQEGWGGMGQELGKSSLDRSGQTIMRTPRGSRGHNLTITENWLYHLNYIKHIKEQGPRQALVF